MTGKQLVRITLSWLCLALTFPSVVQPQIIYNPNDERFKQLALEKTIWVFKEKQFEFQRAEGLLSQSLISKSEFDAKQRDYQHARIEVKQAMLALSQEAPYLVVDKAISQISLSQEAFLRLTVRNAARLDVSDELDTLLRSMSEELEVGGLLELRNVFVSVMDSGVIVGLPYEVQIERLGPGESIELSYRLLKTTSAVTVVSNYLGRIDRRTLLITPATGSSEVVLTANPQSQECVFGGTATYSVDITRSGTSAATYLPIISGLPKGASYRLYDPLINASVPQLHLSAGTARLHVQLIISLPDRASTDLPPDSSFEIEISAKSATDGSIAGVSLIALTSRGAGDLSIYADNWLAHGEVGSKISFPLVLSNVGSRSLDDIRWDIRAPSKWSVSVLPEEIPNLRAGDEVHVTLTVDPGSDVVAGLYELEIQAKSFTASQWIHSDVKLIRLSLESGMTTFVLVFIIAGVVVAVGGVGFGIRRLGKR